MKQDVIKYRRKTDDDEVRDIASILQSKSTVIVKRCTDGAITQQLPIEECEKYVRIVLEANDEIFEVSYENAIKFVAGYNYTLLGCTTVEEFSRKWEVIT